MKHFLSEAIAHKLAPSTNRENNVSHAGNVFANCKFTGATKMFLNLLGNISLGSKFCFRNNVSRDGQTGKH